MDSQMADTRWRVSQASTSQRGKFGTYSTEDFDSRTAPFAAVTNASGVTTSVAFTVIRKTRKSAMLGMVHISASSMTKRGMNACESHQASRLGVLEQNCFANFVFFSFRSAE